MPDWLLTAKADAQIEMITSFALQGGTAILPKAAAELKLTSEAAVDPRYGLLPPRIVLGKV